MNGVKTYHFPTNAKSVYDISGAGGTVIACFTSALLLGIDIEIALNFTNKAAGKAVQYFGTYAITENDLLC